MQTIKTIGRWGFPLLGIWAILYGLMLAFGVSVPGPVILGVLLIVAGILILMAT